MANWQPDLPLDTFAAHPSADDVEATIRDRDGRYGPFITQARNAQLLKDVIRNGMGDVKWQTLQPDQREALEMIAAKLSRIVTGDPHYADSWHDIAGYAQLVAQRLQTRKGA